jgi:choline dehydrogenase-like flavoprotein
LVLDSALGRTAKVGEIAGRYLAEHLLCRAEIPLRYSSLAGGGVNVVIPPPGPALLERFQIDIKTVTTNDGSTRLRISGFAAMDPDPKNRVELHDGVVSTFLEQSSHDEFRVGNMRGRMLEVAEKLGAQSGVEISTPAKWWSNHEVGTLRMGPKEAESVTDDHGRIHDMENLFVADASVFPCVGVANPMLTTTALAYRLAHYIGVKLFREPRGIEPWSICG